LPDKHTEHNPDTDANSKSCNNRRKRVIRIKTAIVILVILLLIIPIICCIILGLQVSRLQNQVNELLSLHSQYELKYTSDDGTSLAYAAVIPEELIIDSSGHTLPLTDALKGNDITSDQAMKESEENPSNADLSTEPEETSLTEETSKNPVEEVFDGEKERKDGKFADKKVYLTFDDGPSIYTDEILDILAEYNVKATFFVVGKTDDESKELYKRIVDEGHTLGMHSYSHKYSKIYNSLEDFDKDFTKLWKLLYDTTGYKPSVYRFPGGSDNMVNKNGMEDFIRYLNEAEMVYFDWNVLNGDATGVTYTKDQLIENVIDGVAIKDNSIVLLHDSQTKKTTVDSLPGLLDELISEDAQILPLDKDVPPIQMIKADTIK
jgi:peptidoglycan-N-acetylglucosamine deacetylase